MSGWKLAAVLGAALLTGAAAPAPDAISLQLSSWGNPLSSWSIDRTGAGLYVSREQAGASGYDLVTTRFDAGPRGYARIARLLAPVRMTPAMLPCAGRATDLPDGEISWHHGARAVATRSLAYGCRSPAWARRFTLVKAADALIDDWAASGTEVARTHSASWR
jgi:hypothetical protein